MWAAPETPFLDAVKLMKQHEVSQLPVVRGSEILGSVREDRVIDVLLRNPHPQKVIVDEVMSEAIPVVGRDAGLDAVALLITPENAAVLVEMAGGTYDILTKYDLIHSITR